LGRISLVLGNVVALRILYERNLEYNNKIYVCYVDYEKAFDVVDLTKLMTILQNKGVDLRDRKLIWNLYNKLVAYVRIEDGLSTACTIGRGVRQGCSLSPLLYLIYDEAVIREATDNMETGISIGCHIINTIRYADTRQWWLTARKGYSSLT